MSRSRQARTTAVIALAIGGILLALLWFRSDMERTSLKASPEELQGRKPTASEIEEPRDEPAHDLEPLQQRHRASVEGNEPQGPVLDVAYLTVTLTRGDTGEPVSDCEVRLRPGPLTVGEVRESEPNRTNTAGTVTFVASVAEPLFVEAGGDFWEPGRELGEANLEVSALTAGEHISVELILPAGIDSEFWGRVLDEQTGAELAGARVLSGESLYSNFAGPNSDEPALVTADGTGLFQLAHASWNASRVCVLQMEGYGTALFQADNLHADPARPLILRMRRSGTLVVQVLDRGVAGFGPDGRVRLEANSYELSIPDDVYISVVDPIWRAELSADGRCEVTVPSRIPLRADVRDQDRVEEIGVPLTLEPGERRSVEWRFGEGTVITGKLLDQFDAPVPNHEVWLTRRGFAGTAREGTMTFNNSDGDKAQARTETDDEGRFEFEDVPLGWWWIGPAAGALLQDMSSDAIAPLATGFEAVEGDSREVEVRTWRGLAIRGRVLDPFGEPARGQGLYASGVEGGGFIMTNSANDGTFTIGPVAPGEFRLVATSFDNYASSEPVHARDGAEDVVLLLREAGSIRGTVVDGSAGDAHSAELWVSYRGEDNRFGCNAGPEGEFFSDGLGPGLYDLFAHTTDGLAGSVSGVEVYPGKESGPVQIVLREGAQVAIRYSGPETYAKFTVFAGEVPVAFDGIHTGTSATHTTPAGTLRVNLKVRTGLEKTVEIDVASGEVREVVFEFE